MEGRRERATETGNNAGLTEEERQRVIELIAEHELSNGSGRKTPAVMDGWNFRMVKKPPQPLKAVSAAELQEMDIPDIEWIVNKILPIGLSMLGAPSKYYKSYMALGLCCDICNGKKFLNFDSKKHGCLYLDLESTRRRPKNRLKQILKEEYFPKNLYILTGTDGVQRIGEGFEEQIRQQLEAHPDIKLIVVDVLQMIRQQAKRNQTGYDRDYEDFKILKQIADSNSLGLMLIHHTRKMKDPYDVFNELSGSVGVMGALDCAWVITKDDRYSDEGTLHITGRDMESQKLKIRFNKKTFQWEYIGTEDDINARRLLKEYEDSQVAETIRRLVKQNNGHWEGSTSDIVEASKILNCQIYDDVRKVGSLINKYEGLFWAVDGINYEYSKGTKGRRKYIFNASLVSNATNATNASNATQLRFDDIK